MDNNNIILNVFCVYVYVYIYVCVYINIIYNLFLCVYLNFYLFILYIYNKLFKSLGLFFF
jgi:hypothetical protein